MLRFLPLGGFGDHLLAWFLRRFRSLDHALYLPDDSAHSEFLH